MTLTRVHLGQLRRCPSVLHPSRRCTCGHLHCDVAERSGASRGWLVRYGSRRPQPTRHSASSIHPTIESVEHDGATIASIGWTPSTAPATYDILPAGPTGTYWANGILVGSTLNQMTVP
jgi:hypothetical protein